MTRLNLLFVIISLAMMTGCSQRSENKPERTLDELAVDYVRLGLFIGQYDPDFVDAYYGPDSLKPATKPRDFPADSVRQSIARALENLDHILKSNTTDSGRAKWMAGQLKAFDRRVRIFTGESGSFDEESQDLFGITAPAYDAEYYQKLIDSLDKILPGKGSIQERFQVLANQFIIPKNKLDTVFRLTIAEARKRTLEHYQLPPNEQFSLEYVTSKPWSGYNWYKGSYRSVIQINTDTDISLERAIDVGSHESYPGHHVYNMLLEKNLYREKGWVEISLYPLFSPQSFIAEGSANYGIALVFPRDARIRFIKNVLAPLVKLPVQHIDTYFSALAIRGRLNYARNEAARGLVNGTMTDRQAVEWLKKYCLYNEETALKSVEFVKKYRSYVINYNYGTDLVRTYVERNGAGSKWETFGYLLSNPVTPQDLRN